MGRVTIDPKDGAGLLLMVGPRSHIEDGDIVRTDKLSIRDQRSDGDALGIVTG